MKKLELANNSNTPIPILIELSKDDDYRVRRAVAYNSNTPVTILAELGKDDDYGVREAVAKNSNYKKSCNVSECKDCKNLKTGFCIFDKNNNCNFESILLINNDEALKQTEGKIRMDLVMKGLAIPLYELGKILTFGLKKYQEDSWKQVPLAKYEAALSRHLNEYFKGNLIDEESGELHLSHALTNLCFMVYLSITNKGE